MTQQRKPLFGFLWPTRTGPVDDDFHQVRFVRVTPRGPVRIAALSVLSLGTVAWIGTTVLASLATGLTVLGLLAAAIAATLLALTLRGWVAGTHVNDAGVRIERTWRRIDIAWHDVRRVEHHSEQVPLLGTALRVAGTMSRLHLDDGSTITTHVYSTSPDLWLRPEAYDIAASRLERWRPGPRP